MRTLAIIVAVVILSLPQTAFATKVPTVPPPASYDWERLDSDFHKSLRAATTLWGVRYDWLHACAHSEGGHGPRILAPGGATDAQMDVGTWYGSVGFFQFLDGTWRWMSNEAWKATRREKNLRIPWRYHDVRSVVGQTFTAAWAFAHGLSYHWYGRSC